jgi:hypothetical protein
MNLSEIEIKAIADEVVRQLAPLLKYNAPAKVDSGGEQSSISIEIARVRAAGLDLGEYLRQRAKVGRQKEKARLCGDSDPKGSKEARRKS